MRRRDFLMAVGTAAAWPLMARAQQPPMPVVIATGSDPVAAGLVASFNRPGGNMTGVTVFSVALELKRLELLRELISPTPLIALLVNPNNLTATAARRQLNDATRKIGQDMVVLEASTEGEFEAVFATLAQKSAGALVVSDDALFANRRSVLVALAARHAIPAIYGRRDFAEVGGLISYGASVADQYYQSGVYVGRILKGAKPSDLPFLQPTKFELTINLKTAKALGLTVPAPLLARADDVIDK